jgi:hypothetical protein
VIIYNFHFVSVAIAPHEADPPLIVDADAVLTGPVAFKSFEVISRRNAKILQPAGGMNVQQLAPGHTLDRPKSGRSPVLEESLAIAGSKGPNQRTSL